MDRIQQIVLDTGENQNFADTTLVSVSGFLEGEPPSAGNGFEENRLPYLYFAIAATLESDFVSDILGAAMELGRQVYGFTRPNLSDAEFETQIVSVADFPLTCWWEVSDTLAECRYLVVGNCPREAEERAYSVHLTRDDDAVTMGYWAALLASVRLTRVVPS